MLRSRVLALVLVLVASHAYAQSTGTIGGRVTDQAGAVLPGVAVTVTNVGTGIARSTVTNNEGLYNVPQLSTGRYDVRTELSGFAPLAKQGIELTAGATLTADFTLGLAQLSESLTVQGQAPLVETTQSAVAGSLRVAEVQSLPILNRNFTGLVTLVPGARPTPPHNSNKGAMGISMSFGGSAGRNVQVEVDGLDNRDDIVGGNMQNFTLEGIQEFKLLAHQFGAEYARAAGAVLQIVSKSGGNELHGSGFMFGRNDAMTAIDYFTVQQSLPKTAYDREQFGGSFGGPIKKDKAFFFGAVERVKQNYNQTFPLRLYNEAQLLIPFGAVPIQTVLYPLRDTMYTLKSDFQLNQRHSLMVRWAQQRNSQDNDLITTNHPDLSMPSTDYNRIWSLIASETWVISNTMVNTFAVQRSYSESATGIPGGLDAPIYPIDRNLTFPSVQVGQAGSTTQQFLQTKWQIKEALSQQLGKHALKIGGDFGSYPDLTINLDVNQRGGVTFFDDPSTIVGSQAAWTANAATCTTARFVPGSATACGPYRQGFQTPGAVSAIQQGTRGAGGPIGDSSYVGLKQFGAFIQDDWKVTPRLTLNLGLRYDLALNFFDQSELANSRTYLALKAIGSPYGALPKTPTKDFSPRAGFAWDINGDGRSVLRGGGGIYFDMPSQSNGWTIAIQSKPSLYIAGTLVNTAVGVGQLANYVYGVSPFPSIIPATPTQLPRGGNTSGVFWDPAVTDPYSIQGHIGFSKQLTNATVVSTDYTHVEGRHELRFGGGNRQVNPIEGPWDPTADPSVYGRRRLAPAFAATLGDPNILGAISINVTANESRFDEWIAHVEQRAGRATFQGSYTLAWARGYGGCAGGGGGINAACIAPVNQDRLLTPEEWGPTPTDERHRVVLSGVFELPAGVQVSPIFQAASGRPYTMTAGRDLNGDGINSDRYIDPATGQMVGVNSARGDATWNLDARITKFFTFGRSRLGVFAELYNITDRVNFGQYNGNALSAVFRQPTGYFAGLPSSRQLQLGGRFSF